MASVLLLVAIALGFGLRRAESEAWKARQNLYAADMNLAFQALDGNNLGRAKQLLQKYQNDPKLRGLRGWEWRHLWGRCRSDELATLGRFPTAVHTVAFSADGRRIVGISDDGTFQLFEIDSRRVIATLKDTNGTEGLHFSGDGRWLIRIDLEHKLRLSDATTLREIAGPIIHTNEINCFAVSPNGEELATIGGGLLRLWNLKAAREVLRQEFREAASIVFSPNGAALAIRT